MRDRLDALVAGSDDHPHSPLHRIKASSSNPSVGGMKRLLAKLELIEATGVLKTEFVLQYMSEPQLRAKVRRGLLKVEQLHALAHAVYYGQRGRISAREVYDQVSACLCLTLILACIVYWQAREISRIAAAPDFPFDPRPAASCQPDRVQERHPLRRDQDRPRQAQDAPALACISARIWSVPSTGRQRMS